MPTMAICAAFDGGNIDVIDASDPARIRLEIRKDTQSDFYQWFYFRLTGARGTDCAMVIENAAGAAYPGGWPDYQALASYDRQHWQRVPTDFRDGKLTIRHAPLHDAVWYAYFAPYTTERHYDLIGSVQGLPGVRVTSLTKTLDGQDLDCITVGATGENASAKKKCWITARQHPGETMAEWCAEGLIERLLDPDDAIARALREKCVFYIVPNMNPDGSQRGHLRTNACGANLNREWAEPSATRSPEVLAVLEKMQETGVDFFLDCHGDEALPYNFIAGGNGAPGFDERLGALLADYRVALERANPDFQSVYGYPIDPPGRANMTVATNNITGRFGCLAMTLEMPFKDNANAPDPAEGWSPERSIKLGASQLDALWAVVDRLR